MKILHLLYESRDDYFGIGGVGVRAYEIYRRLRDRHDITLLCKKYPGDTDGEIEGLRHVFVGAASRNFTRSLLSYAWHAVQYVRRHGNEFDIIVEEFSPAIPTFLHAFTKRPVVLQVQGHTGLLYFRKYNPLYAVILTLMERLRPIFYDHFVFIGPETVRKFSLKGKGNREIIPNGISPELLNALPGEGDYVLYLGRLDIYGKGLDLLLQAYCEFYRSFPGIRLVIAGDGRDREKFMAEIRKMPKEVRQNIGLPGWVSGERKTEALLGALCVVFPSRHEVQPIAVLEAMAAGKAVIVSDIPEFSFVTESGAGMSFRTGDALSLARSMKELMPGRVREEMGKRGRDQVKALTWDRIAERYEGFLKAIVESEG